MIIRARPGHDWKSKATFSFHVIYSIRRSTSCLVNNIPRFPLLQFPIFHTSETRFGNYSYRHRCHCDFKFALNKLIKRAWFTNHTDVMQNFLAPLTINWMRIFAQSSQISSGFGILAKFRFTMSEHGPIVAKRLSDKNGNSARTDPEIGITMFCRGGCEWLLWSTTIHECAAFLWRSIFPLISHHVMKRKTLNPNIFRLNQSRDLTSAIMPETCWRNSITGLSTIFSTFC